VLASDTLDGSGSAVTVAWVEHFWWLFLIALLAIVIEVMLAVHLIRRWRQRAHVHAKHYEEGQEL